ncbi:MAG TPA: sugar phosphate isomerase/epimerase [Cyclobacteriaceae bacterium]|nr:sugar phosphate isomerase/epimerase [Cyclobacteriaceae bacterium]
MNQSRRDFMKKSALAIASASLANQSLLAIGKGNAQLGIQLYTIRDDMKKDPLATLKQIAAIGYKNVEHADYRDRKFYGYAAKDFKKVLSDVGLKMPSGHTVLGKKHWDETKKDFTDAWKYTIDDAATAGQQYVVSPWLDESIYQSEDALLQFMEVFNKCGELCVKSGMKFGYHNHHFEFSKQVNGKVLYDLILGNTDPKLVTQQLDTGNLFNGGAKAIDVIKKYPNRFELMHVKDEIKAPAGGEEKYESTILGKGIAQVKEVIDLGKAGGVKHMIVEQEAYQGKSPIDSAKEDFEAMKGWGYM